MKNYFRMDKVIKRCLKTPARQQVISILKQFTEYEKQLEGQETIPVATIKMYEPSKKPRRWRMTLECIDKGEDKK